MIGNLHQRLGGVAGVAIAVVLAATAWGDTAQEEGSAAPSAAAVITSSSPIGEVRFPHALHAEEIGVECAGCHHETNAARLRLPHEEYFADFWIDCAICHRETDTAAVPQSCGACHHAVPSSNADETLSAKVVIHQSCWSCHEIGTGREASANCRFCHRDGRLTDEGGP